MSKRIRLFWWNERVIQGKENENYGDLLGKYLVEKISGKTVVFAWPKRFSLYNFFSPIYFTIGSILTNVDRKCIVWGSGIISKKFHIKRAKFLAVRGPQTRSFLLNLGYEVPEVYGDPAILLPKYFNPPVERQFEIGVVPHYNDFKRVLAMMKAIPNIKVIDLMTDDIEKTTIEILQCRRIVSSSLHGLIVSHAYGIPAVWQKFSNDVFGDDIKYQDYFESIGIPVYNPGISKTVLSTEELIGLFDQYPSLPNSAAIEEIKENLLAVCPFKSLM